MNVLNWVRGMEPQLTHSFVHIFRNFCRGGVRKCEIWLIFLTPSRLWSALVLRRSSVAYYRISKTCIAHSATARWWWAHTSPSKMALRRSRFVGQSSGAVRSSWLDDPLLASLLPPYRLARLLRRAVCHTNNTQLLHSTSFRKNYWEAKEGFFFIQRPLTDGLFWTYFDRNRGTLSLTQAPFIVS